MVEIRTFRESEQARKRLVDSLREQGAIRSELVALAFRAIPREVFVPVFYEQEGFVWVKRMPEAGKPTDWIAAIYRDQPLVTLVDERNRSISSSSMPTVMAMMLEALSVEPGMRVLEIGTGTGYNAALLAHLTGDPALVTSIDLEERLALAAGRTLHEVVGPVSVHVGDGRLGVSLRAPYDRILATASSPGIPRAWYEQLVPGGRLVMDLQGSLHKSSFLVLEKAADGQARGWFDPRALFFMPLRSPGEAASHPTSRLLREPVSGEVTLSEEQMAILRDDAFLWFLQWDAPGITLSRATALQGRHAGEEFVTLVDPKLETLLQLYHRNGQWSGYQHGGTGMWKMIERAYERWHGLGRPALSSYEVVWDKQHERFVLVCGSRTFPF